MADELRSYLEAGEALRFEDDLRSGGRIGISDERLLVLDEQVRSVPFENVDELRFQSFDWFLMLMSLGLVAFGLFSITIHVLGGLAFAGAGVVSVYLTYRKRGRVTVKLHSQVKPVVFHLDDTASFREEMELRMERFTEEQESA